MMMGEPAEPGATVTYVASGALRPARQLSGGTAPGQAAQRRDRAAQPRMGERQIVGDSLAGEAVKPTPVSVLPETVSEVIS